MKRMLLVVSLMLSGCMTLDPNFCGGECVAHLDNSWHAPNWYANGGPGLPSEMCLAPSHWPQVLRTPYNRYPNAGRRSR